MLCISCKLPRLVGINLKVVRRVTLYETNKAFSTEICYFIVKGTIVESKPTLKSKRRCCHLYLSQPIKMYKEEIATSSGAITC